MKKLTLFFAVFCLLAMIGLPSAQALNITIIESQSWSAAHTMDNEWAAVATAMGHTPTIMPQSTLDTGTFIPGTDVLIISSPYIPLTAVRINYIYECMYAGKGVYIQAESSPADQGNVTWQTLVNMYATAFTWGGTMGGPLRPTVHNHIGAEYNAKPIMDLMVDGCFAATWDPGVEGNLRWQANDVGYVFDPLNFPFAGMAMTNTDYEWILTAPDYALMENYIDVLIEQPPLELTIRIFPVGGPITLPSGGGSFDYQVQVVYTGWTTINWFGWIRLILPSGAVYSPPLVGPASYSWAAATTTPLYTFTQFIPAFAPPGTYFVQAVGANNYPGFVTCFDSDNFMFQKLVISPDGEEAEPVSDWKSIGSFDMTTANDTEPVLELPQDFSVGQAYPNPFNPSTTINVTLGEASQLTIAVYDVQGREVASLANGQFNAGQHEFSFNANGLASGVYFLQASVPGQNVETRKLVLMQ